MGKTVNFVVVFEDGVRKRHYHETDRGKVLYFAVQLELRVNEDWKPVVRYDCSHRFSHKDKYDIKGNKTKLPLDLSFESALTFGEWDIDENWSKYREGFLRGG
ncbi:MAG: hypothetical protein U5R49_16870 [Deltaproteobacteria bacterium]|nr:hypothetical protein [Deltaproteobacteria bacterium]